MNLEDMRLAVVSNVVHYGWDGKLYAYAPYAREIELWADLFRDVIIAAPYREQMPPGDCIAFECENISVHEQLEAGGDSLIGKLGLLLTLPKIASRLIKTFRAVDAIHLRCPCNLGFFGAVLGPLFSTKLVAKYAGQWPDYSGEATTTRWQKRLLQSRWFRSPVTVYGKWPGAPAHIVPFFTSVLTREQIARARAASRRSRANGPLQVLFVGRLTASKNVDVLLRAIANVRKSGADVRCSVVGEGPERSSLQQISTELGLSEFVEFTGGVDFDQVLEYFENSDALVLASETEGWPKALTEAMAFGLTCIGSDRGLVPQILSENRGIVVPPRNLVSLTDALQKIANNREEYEPMRVAAAAWAQQYSLEGLREALRELLIEHWSLETKQAAEPAVIGS